MHIDVTDDLELEMEGCLYHPCDRMYIPGHPELCHSCEITASADQLKPSLGHGSVCCSSARCKSRSTKRPEADQQRDGERREIPHMTCTRPVNCGKKTAMTAMTAMTARNTDHRHEQGCSD